MDELACDVVTKVIARVPRPGVEADLACAIRILKRAVMRTSGHVDVHIHLMLPAQPGYGSVYEDESCTQKQAWEEYARLHRPVEEANRYAQGQPATRSPETWFRLPTTQGPTLPAWGRMTAATIAGGLPLVYAFGWLVAQLLPAQTPAFLRVLAGLCTGHTHHELCPGAASYVPVPGVGCSPITHPFLNRCRPSHVISAGSASNLYFSLDPKELKP